MFYKVHIQEKYTALSLEEGKERICTLLRDFMLRDCPTSSDKIGERSKRDNNDIFCTAQTRGITCFTCFSCRRVKKMIPFHCSQKTRCTLSRLYISDVSLKSRGLA